MSYHSKTMLTALKPWETIVNFRKGYHVYNPLNVDPDYAIKYYCFW